MSMTYFAANESVAMAPSFAAPAWACTGCFGCREHCDHHNDVTGTLFEARSAFVTEGVAPPSATRAIDRFDERASVLRENAKELAALSDVSEHAGTAVLVGCAYARASGQTPTDAVRTIAKLGAEKVSVVDVCCGAPLLYAGDKKRFAQQGEMLAQVVKHKEQLVVLDAGCASTIRIHLAELGIDMIAPVVHFTEFAARQLAKLEPIDDEALAKGPVRYHDPCQLGRGLGVYDAPRDLLARALGRAPDEFARTREDARCSGGGGLLPVTMPDVASTMAGDRLAEHEANGGGTVVTACASSLRSFQKRGANAVDLVTLVARAAGVR